MSFFVESTACDVFSPSKMMLRSSCKNEKDISLFMHLSVRAFNCSLALQ